MCAYSSFEKFNCSHSSAYIFVPMHSLNTISMEQVLDQALFFQSLYFVSFSCSFCFLSYFIPFSMKKEYFYWRNCKRTLFQLKFYFHHLQISYIADPMPPDLPCNFFFRKMENWLSSDICSKVQCNTYATSSAKITKKKGKIYMKSISTV